MRRMRLVTTQRVLFTGFALGVTSPCAERVLLAQAARRVDIVSTTGCLREQPAGTWTLVNATDPVKSTANAPTKKELPTTPVTGKREFHLIGVGEFDLPSLKGQLILVKGLHIVATPVSRLNVTSVMSVALSCPATSSRPSSQPSSGPPR